MASSQRRFHSYFGVKNDISITVSAPAAAHSPLDHGSYVVRSVIDVPYISTSVLQTSDPKPFPYVVHRNIAQKFKTRHTRFSPIAGSIKPVPAVGVVFHFDHVFFGVHASL